MPLKTYADYDIPGASEAFEEVHFSGKFGAYLKVSDEKVLDDFIPEPIGSVLDIGAGSGRLSRYLARRGTGFIIASDASIEMLRTAARRCEAPDRPGLVHCDAQVLPFSDKSFDFVVSFRTLMHLPDWHRAVSEMCRVARCGVILDAPASFGAPGAEAFFHRIMHLFDDAVEPYRTFSLKVLKETFERNDFIVQSVDRRFVLPVKLYRKVKYSNSPERVESALKWLGLNRLLGGQYVIKAVPR